MRLAFCFSRSWRPYPTILALRSLPCWPGAKLRFSIGHLSLKHFVPLRNSFMPSRRHKRHTASLYLAKFSSPIQFAVQFTGLADLSSWTNQVSKFHRFDVRFHFQTFETLQRETLYSPSLRRTTAVVRNRRHVFNRANFDSCRGQRANGRLATRAWTADADFDGAHSMIARHVSGVHCGLLRRKRRAFART